MYHSHHPGCSHLAVPEAAGHKIRLLWLALVLVAACSLAEFAVSFSSHSLALLAEAGHMLSDCFALGLALLASWIAQLPASNRATFGYRRIEILAALVNATALLAIAIWVAWEAIPRLQAPPDDILSVPMLITAAIGFGVNSLNATLLHDHSQLDLNLRGAFLHMVADAVGSVGVLLAAIAVWQLHWAWADGAVSLLVAGFMAVTAVPLIRQSLHILLEQTPNYIDLSQIEAKLTHFDGVMGVSNLRVWAIALGQVSLSAHLTVSLRDGFQRDRLLHQVQTVLQNEFAIQEVAIQMSGPLAVESISLSQPARLEALLQTPVNAAAVAQAETSQNLNREDR